MYRYQLLSNQNSFIYKLRANTLLTGNTQMAFTDKQFVGSVANNQFRIIQSEGAGVFCAFHGDVKEDNNQLILIVEAKLQQVFVILYFVWALIISLVYIVFTILQKELNSQSILIIIALVGVRILLHKIYLYQRNRGLKKIEDLMN